MSPRRWIIPPLIALAGASCAEEPTTGLGSLDEALDLELLVPVVSPEMFVDRRFSVFGASDSLGPARSEDMMTEESGIWNAYTDVEIGASQVQAWGEHDYVGNKGRVEVRAYVYHDGLVIGERLGSEEQTHVFLSPFVHHIIGGVIINIDEGCGLSADAQTEHHAWWEMVPGSGPSSMGRTVRPTYSTRKAQPLCEPVVDYGGGGTGDTGGGGGGLPEELTTDYTCYMWFTYDQETLEVLDIHATWCTGGG